MRLAKLTHMLTAQSTVREEGIRGSSDRERKGLMARICVSEKRKHNNINQGKTSLEA
jgi:hypothetical protein